MELLHARDLLPLTLEPNWPDLDPDRHRALIVALDAAEPLNETASARIGAWLQHQPVPVVGLVRDCASPLLDGVDVLVDDEADLQRIVLAIDKNPNASSVLVQVLRAVGRLATDQALALESMAYATLQGGGEFSAWLRRYRAEHPPRRAKAEQHAPVLLERSGERLRVVLNSPSDRNALSVHMRDALTEAFKLVALDPAIARVEVSANGPCFSAGGDLSEFGSAEDLAESHRIRMLRMPAQYLAACAERCTVRVHGACIGAGIEMPAFAGRIEATRDAFFQLPEVAMGLIPGAGGCVSIPRRVGRQRAAYLAISGEPIAAQVALDWGLVDALVD